MPLMTRTDELVGFAACERNSVMSDSNAIENAEQNKPVVTRQALMLLMVLGLVGIALAVMI